MPTRPDTINTTVATAGTQIQIGSPSAPVIVEEFTFRPNVGITGIIYFGAADVSSTNGFPLSDGESLEIKNSDGSPVDLSMYWIDASVDGEGGVSIFHRED